MARQRMMISRFFTLSVVSALAACEGGGGSDAGTDGGASGFTEADIIAAVTAFDTEGFTRISAELVATQHAADQAHVWASNAHVAAYRAIDPEDTTATAAEFPVGTILIKQHHDAAGEPDGSLTVMGKLDDGFSEDNNWWWGRFGSKDAEPSPAGTPALCIDCHKNNDLVRTDYVYGVHTANQAP